MSPTQTFRPLRRLLSSSVSLPISLPLFACAHSNHAHFLFLCFSFPPFFFHFLSFLSSPFSLFYTAPTLWHETDSAVGRSQQIRWSANLVCFPWSINVCACMCVWHSTGYGTGESSAFLSQLVTQKPQVRSGR